MQIKVFVTGPIDVNTYVVYDENTNDGVVFDVGGSAKEIAQFTEENDIKISAIYATHGHFDHVTGARELQGILKVPFYMSGKDAIFVENLPSQLNMYGLKPVLPPKITGYIDENSHIFIGKEKVKVIETPGHTIGGLSFLVGNSLFSGDTLFYESVGRTDLPTGDYETLKKSIREKLFKLPDDIKVYPGHDISTTIGHEKENNFQI